MGACFRSVSSQRRVLFAAGYGGAQGWADGPDLPADASGVPLWGGDTPACLLPNGHVFFLGVENGNGQFADFDPQSGAFTLVFSPPNSKLSAEGSRLLPLPSGQVLFTGPTQLWLYTPDGPAPLATWKPTITKAPKQLTQITALPPTYELEGTQFNGLSQAASFGDDAQMATNYPIVRLLGPAKVLKGPSGTPIPHFGPYVLYLRTFNHSTMGVATGSTVVKTQFSIPAGTKFPLPPQPVHPGPKKRETVQQLWGLEVVANGIPSDPVLVEVEFEALV